MSRHAVDITGQQFGFLTVICRDRDTSRNPSQAMWKCQCVCGKEHAVSGAALRRGQKSCGCKAVELTSSANTKHGHSQFANISKTYRAWRGILNRCNNPNVERYPEYGGRGITVCDRWGTFEAFLDDMGESPDGMSIDRIDVNGNYEPSNCRWATNTEQSHNKRNSRLITYNGETKCASEWCRLFNHEPSVFRNRLKRGWSIHEAITKPSRRGPNIRTKHRQ